MTAAPETAETPENEGSSEIALFFGMSSQRLKSRARFYGAALALVLFMPYEIVDDKPQFIWQLAPELPLAGVIAAFAPVLAAALILICTYTLRRASSLALGVLASLGLAALLIRIGADASAWEVLPLPESLTDHPLPALVALALTAAGSNLAFRLHARRASRFVLGAAVACALLFYAWPSRGEAPFVTLIRALALLPEMPGFRFQLGLLILAMLALFPLVVPLVGLMYISRPPNREQPGLTAVALYGLPAILLMFVYRSLLGAQGGAGILSALISIAALTALLALIASAVEILVESLALPREELERVDGFGHPVKGLPLRSAALIALAAVAVLAGAQWALARPPKKGVEWAITPPTKEGDELFGKLLPAWDNARLSWDRRVRKGSSAQGMVDVKANARELVSAARASGPGLGGAFEALTRESGDLDLAGRRFFRLVEDINEQSRVAGLPYYIDPTVSIYQTDEGLLRHFYVHPYRIEKVRRVRAGGVDLATLEVRNLGSGRDGHLRLGFSRDIQPFALVVMDELEPYEKELSTLAAAVPPRCVDAESEDATIAEPLARCGELLASAVRAPGGLMPGLVAGTERHELQHQLDGPHLVMSPAVLRRMAAYSDDVQRRVNRELSAYVAELTAEGMSGRLGLVHIFRHALLGRRGVEHHVGILAFEALSDRKIRGADGKDDRAALGRAFAEVAAMGDDSLRARAASAWRDLFGATLPAFEPMPD
ncbi:hypothetical protein [Polyangium aurulentum]|uniref:hypothetical protein n=1 Tax=Polyangium aurulentum TaxID=2567896 RepID=UPI0010AE7357|nr:hypothetical protein [Polyangium aurulentum]UQA60975.1 hypothetical protein E8A73_011055 [Polyangium aurulentum]